MFDPSNGFSERSKDWATSLDRASGRILGLNHIGHGKWLASSMRRRLSQCYGRFFQILSASRLGAFCSHMAMCVETAANVVAATRIGAKLKAVADAGLASMNIG